MATVSSSFLIGGVSLLMTKKAPNPIDKHVGSRVRMRRMMLAISQEKLGDALGLTFQQVQKYEKGTNRIGASRLQQISHVLQVPVAFFFEGAPLLNQSPTWSRRLPGSRTKQVTDLGQLATALHPSRRADAATP